MLRSLWAAFQFLFRRPADLVHVHTSHRFSFYRASFYVLFAAWVWRRPVILHIHGSSFDEFVETNDVVVRWLQSTVFEASDSIIVLSEYWQEVLASQVPEEKISILPNAVDPDEYTPMFGVEPLHLVFVSNLIERKGVPELIEAIDALEHRSSEFRVTIAGKGPLVDTVEELAARHENVEYLGYVSEVKKRELLESSSVFILPTHAEGLPIAMLEGMAGGNAVVSTTVGSIPEVIHDENGILIEPGDATQLADAIESLVKNVEGTREMARRNHACRGGVLLGPDDRSPSADVRDGGAEGSYYPDDSCGITKWKSAPVVV
jgi:glycosyltransferase involved in cell wall biosynthesis